MTFTIRFPARRATSAHAFRGSFEIQVNVDSAADIRKAVTSDARCAAGDYWDVVAASI
jgi:hypothetical protein